MTQRRHHYEQVFEQYLRDRRLPYVAVNEARKTLLPAGAPLRLEAPGEAPVSLKSFDFVVYGPGCNLLVEIKGRRFGRPGRGSTVAPGTRRMDSWVCAEDVESMTRWQELFGPEFESVFVFLYWCEEFPPDGVFEEVVERRGRWYALRSVSVREYAKHMRVRSRRWGTVHVDATRFAGMSEPFRPWATGAVLEPTG